MEQKTIFIKNRNRLNMSVRITKPDNADKLAFLEHGLSGSKDEAHMLILEEELAEKRYIVVNIDATDSLNKSDKSKTGATFTGYYNDLEDVINWAQSQSWYQEPFTLAGQSIGAATTLLYAENHPEKINLLLPISFPWLSGKSKIAQDGTEKIEKWNTAGYMEMPTRTRGILHVPYSNFMTDLLKYDFAENANKIKAKTVLIIGDQDKPLRLEDNRNLFDILDCDKDLIVLPNTPHCTANTPENAKTFRKAVKKAIS